MKPFEKMSVFVTMKSGEEKNFWDVTEFDKDEGWIMIGHVVHGFDKKEPQVTLIAEGTVAQIVVLEDRE